MTTRVDAALTGANGSPLVGAVITARLSAPIVAASVVAPTVVTRTTDANGLASLTLYPNGTSGTTYTFEIIPAGVLRPIVYRGITVPDVAVVSLAVLLGGSAGVVGALTIDGGTVLIDGAPIVFA